MAPNSSRDLLRWSLWFAFANAALLSVVGLRNFAFASLPHEPLAQLFLALMVPGHFLALSLVAWPLVALPAVLVPRPGVRAWGIAVYTILAALVVADTFVFALYRFHLNPMVWNLVTSGVADEILPFSAAAFVQGGLGVAVVAALETLLSLAIWRLVRARARLRGALFAGAMAVVMVAGQGLHVWADAWLYTPITRQLMYLPWSSAITAYGFLERRGWVAAEDAEAHSVPFSESGLDYPRGSLDCTPPADPLNVLVIVIEEWRFDELDPVTSPNLWRFAEESFVFERHFSAGNASRYGVFGLLYGLHGTYWDAVLSEQRGSLLVTEALRRGYRFGVFGSASLLHPEFDRTAFAPIRDRIDLRTEGATSHDRDRRISEQLIERIDEAPDEPFFGFLFFDSPHSMDVPPDWQGPYAPARSWGSHLELGPDTDPLPLRNGHRNSVHYVDHLTGEILDALRARGLLERTAVVVTGDHGEEFNENGQNYWGHNGNFGRYQTQVPLVLHLPGTPPGRSTARTSHVDVVPTLLADVFGCSAPPERYSNGRHLFDEGPRRYLLASGRSVGIAILEPERITLLQRYGPPRVLDADLRELDEAPDAALIGAAMRETARFYSGDRSTRDRSVPGPTGASGASEAAP